MQNGELGSAEQINDDCEVWKASFARDQRASFIQNHDHDCTNTCVKYQKMKIATELQLPQRAGQKIAWTGIPMCRFRFFRHFALRSAASIKYAIKYGKELLENVFIARHNDEKECGKYMLPRQSRFKSSSMDGHQSTLRCNADDQYHKRQC